MKTPLAPSTSPARWAAASASVSTSRARAVISWTFSTERIWPGIFSSTLWHWSSMKATPESGPKPPPRITSYMMRNSWNGSAGADDQVVVGVEAGVEVERAELARVAAAERR